MTKPAIGKRVGRLVVTGIEYKEREDGKKIQYYMCHCDCGTDKLIHVDGIRKGRTKSCGCLKKEVDTQKAKTMGDANVSHGLSKSRIYKTWDSMRRRCNNPKQKGYEHYGGRGITYATAWNTFEAFYEDTKGGYKEYLTIERIDVNGCYCKYNCTWIPMELQAGNRQASKRKTAIPCPHRLSTGIQSCEGCPLIGIN